MQESVLLIVASRYPENRMIASLHEAINQEQDLNHSGT